MRVAIFRPAPRPRERRLLGLLGFSGIGAAVLGISCRQPTPYTRREESAPPPQTVAAGHHPAALVTRVRLPSVTLEGPEAPAMAMGLVAVGEFAVIADRTSNPHVRVLSLRDGAVRSRALPHGDGRGEVMDISQLEMTQVRGDSAWLSGSDLPRRRAFELLLRPDGVLETLRVDSVMHPIPNNVLQRYPTVSGALLFGATTTALVVRIDTVAHRVVYVSGQLPHDSVAFPTGRGLADANWRRAARRPSLGDVAVVYEHAGRLDIFDAGGRWRQTVATPRTPTLAFRLRPENRAVVWLAQDQLGFVDVAATEARIYALYCGCRHGSFGASYLQVYRWDGTFEQEYQLDPAVYRIAVTPDDRRVLGVTLMPQPRVVAWDILRSNVNEGTAHVVQR